MTYRHTIHAWADVDDARVPLDIKALDLALADTWSPHVKGEARATALDDAVLAALDPRQTIPPVVDVVVDRHAGSAANSLAAWTAAIRGMRARWDGVANASSSYLVNADDVEIARNIVPTPILSSSLDGWTIGAGMTTTQLPGVGVEITATVAMTTALIHRLFAAMPTPVNPGAECGSVVVVSVPADAPGPVTVRLGVMFARAAGTTISDANGANTTISPGQTVTLTTPTAPAPADTVRVRPVLRAVSVPVGSRCVVHDGWTISITGTPTDILTGDTAPPMVAAMTRLGLPLISSTWSTWYNAGPEDGQRMTAQLTVDQLRDDARTGETIIEIGGPELRLQDAQTVRGVQLTGSTLRYAINDLLARLHLGAVVEAPDMTYLAPLWPSGTTAWDAVDGWLKDIDHVLLCDERGQWRIVDRNAETPADPVVFEDLISLDRSMSRTAEWYDAVCVVWKWETENIVDPEKPLPVSFEEWAGVPDYSRLLVVERDAQYPGPDLAQRLYERHSRRGETHRYQAPADLDVRPLARITLTDRRGPRPATLTEVRWEFPTGVMTVTTKE